MADKLSNLYFWGEKGANTLRDNFSRANIIYLQNSLLHLWNIRE